MKKQPAATRAGDGGARRRDDDPSDPDDPAAQAARLLTPGAPADGIDALEVVPGLHDVVAPHVRWTEVPPNRAPVRFIAERGDPNPVDPILDP